MRSQEVKTLVNSEVCQSLLDTVMEGVAVCDRDEAGVATAAGDGAEAVVMTGWALPRWAEISLQPRTRMNHRARSTGIGWVLDPDPDGVPEPLTFASMSWTQSGRKHCIEQFDSFETMRYGIPHQPGERYRRVGEVREELDPLDIVVGHSNRYSE